MRTIILSFVIWNILIQTVDVKTEGIAGKNVEFATVNTWFYMDCNVS